MNATLLSVVVLFPYSPTVLVIHYQHTSTHQQHKTRNRRPHYKSIISSRSQNNALLQRVTRVDDGPHIGDLSVVLSPYILLSP